MKFITGVVILLAFGVVGASAADTTETKAAKDTLEKMVATDTTEIKSAKDTLEKKVAVDTLEKRSTTKETTKAKADSLEKTSELKWTKTKSGLRYADAVVGEGPECKNGDKVTCHYTVWLADGDKPGKRLQSSKDSNRPFPCTLGKTSLIKGWVEGMMGMRKGGIRFLIIPSDIGYGARGKPPMIPGGATLFFEIEVLEHTAG